MASSEQRPFKWSQEYCGLRHLAFTTGDAWERWATVDKRETLLFLHLRGRVFEGFRERRYLFDSVDDVDAAMEAAERWLLSDGREMPDASLELK